MRGWIRCDLVRSLPPPLSYDPRSYYLRDGENVLLVRDSDLSLFSAPELRVRGDLCAGMEERGEKMIIGTARSQCMKYIGNNGMNTACDQMREGKMLRIKFQDFLVWMHSSNLP